MTTHRLRHGTSTDHPQSTCQVLGGNHLGAALAGRLRAAGHDVAVVDESYDSTELPGVRGDPTDVRTLSEADVADASTVVVAGRSDRENLLIAQLVRARFDVPRVVALVNQPDRLDVVADAGHETVCATSTLAVALAETV